MNFEQDNQKETTPNVEPFEFYNWMNNRIDGLKQLGGFGGSNCIGTAFYIVGEFDTDKYIYSAEHEKILNNLTRKDSPEEGFLIGWHKDGETSHLGVITRIEPLLVTNRHGCGDL